MRGRALALAWDYLFGCQRRRLAMDNYLDLMCARREQILERFYAALDRAGRPHDAARLIAVSKTVGVDETVAAIQAGYQRNKHILHQHLHHPLLSNSWPKPLSHRHPAVVC